MGRNQGRKQRRARMRKRVGVHLRERCISPYFMFTTTLLHLSSTKKQPNP